MQRHEVITGFHAVEEYIRSCITDGRNSAAGCKLLCASGSPRIQKILGQALLAGIPCTQTQEAELDRIVSALDITARSHRGLVLLCPASARPNKPNLTDLDTFLKNLPEDGTTPVTLILLDSITDPHNMGAILRSCDQFGVSLAIVPDRKSADTNGSIVARSSAGASAWIPVAKATNLVRAVQKCKDKGFWVYGADAKGTKLNEIHFAPRTLIILGSEGSGISRLLARQCDVSVAIPTCGRLDSLNVSVAAGILLYAAFIR